MSEQQDETKGAVGQSHLTVGLGEEDICGLCGLGGADKMAMWTGGGIYWPGETRPETEFVHAECEMEETKRAHAALSQPQRDAVIRAANGGLWP